VNGAEQPRERELARLIGGVIRDRLPAGWSLEEGAEGRADQGCADLVLTFRAPDGSSALVIGELKQVLEGRDVGPVAGKLAAYRAQFGAVVGIVGARYLSPQTRARLTERGISYVDVTGNLRLQVDAPALFLADRGADADPWRGPGRPRGTLKGAPAAAIVRAILDLSSEWTMSDLIAISGVSTGAAYRVVDFLETEGLVERPSRGVIVVLDWVRVLRRWGEDYGFVRNTTVSRWIAPRGLDDLIARAADSPASLQYCFTGTVAAAEWAEYAPTRAAMVYTHDASATAETWGLRPAEAGANVLLGEPELRVPFVRTAKRADELTLAAPAQVAVDLMSGPGRNPAEAEELLDWMQAHEKSWRGHR
jgi:hypothetical protein